MKLDSMTWQDVAAKAPGTVVAVPIAAVEQHGLHLPVTTDTDLVTSIALAAERRLPDELVLCPTLPYGSSDHHLSFPGTLSVPPAVYTDLMVGLLNSLVASGFRRIILLNGHGGNSVPVRQALAIVARQVSPAVEIALVTYWELGGSAFTGLAPMQSPALSHACEYETSMMLSIASDRVRFERVKRARRPDPNEYVPWEDEAPGRGVYVVRGTEFISSNGSSGEPQLATAEKGLHLLAAAVETLVAFVHHFAQWQPMEDLRNG